MDVEVEDCCEGFFFASSKINQTQTVSGFRVYGMGFLYSPTPDEALASDASPKKTRFLDHQTSFLRLRRYEASAKRYVTSDSQGSVC